MTAGPLRVLHISSVYPPQIVGGAEKVVAMLAEAQARRGYRVGAASLTRGAQPAAERHGVATLPQASRNLLWMEDVFASPRPMRTANKLGQLVNRAAASDFAEAIGSFRPHIVHTHSMVELPPMIWARAAASGARVVHTLHDYDLICSRASLFRNGHNCQALHPSCRVTAAWKARFARSIDAVAAVSAPVLAEHRRHGLFAALPAERARVVWNGVETDRARHRPPRSGDIVFGFLGRLVPEKGIDVLLDACRLLPQPGWRLRVAGRAQEGDSAYRDRAAGLPIDWLGFADPDDFVASIDVLVVPSVWREPFGLTVVEAFAAGVPVIGTASGAIPDLLGAVGSDWIVPPGDAPTLARMMTAVIEQGRDALPDPERFAPLLARVRPDAMVDAYDQLYAAALAAAARAA